ncbi:von Willebrand factor type A domain protein [Anaerovibrio sp. JC8]|uniref:vWA domain-containing protein n=1 Tax=Anaerovibrio sp. JC8 TaxID=1240085 RepID=UPI000A0D5227|nr:VWA domain-containing protein [Anaerovibrio sp. JC8]ORU00832.1 von Willebrand factor type A domain protein [Anaerovibrio sp. JC8]
MNNMLRIDDLVNNPTARVPICLCLDTSDSMLAVEGDCVQTGETVFRDGKMWNIVTGGTTRLEELEKGIELFYQAIREDEVAVFSAEICIVTFNNKATCVLDFANIDRQAEIPELEANGDTYMGEGVNLALDLLEKRKKEYQDAGVDYYQPWLVLMTDGEPNGNATELENAVKRTVNMVNDKKLTVFSIGIGNEADMRVLNRFSPKRKALKLKEMRFGQFFEWLGKSVARTSQSMPGENVTLDLKGIEDWGTL